jgi:hypothetical protein
MAMDLTSRTCRRPSQFGQQVHGITGYVRPIQVRIGSGGFTASRGSMIAAAETGWTDTGFSDWSL